VVRGAYVLARVAVTVRVAARWLWWLGILAAGIGVFVPSLLGRRIGVLAGAAIFIVAAALAFWLRRKRYVTLADAATRAPKSVFLQDSRVTARAWTRSRRWWLLLFFLLAIATSAVAPAAGGLLLAGVGFGLWAKALWLGRLERSRDVLLWVRPEAGKDDAAYETTGPVAGDAGPGGSRRKASAALR
jgi:hypothetical protein